MATQLDTQQRRESFNCSQCGEPTDAFTGTARHGAIRCRRCFGKRKDLRPRELNELTGKEWAARSKSVETYPDQRSAKQKEHGAAFPKSLAAAHIEMYTKPGEVVLDPFVGVGTTVDAAIELGRFGVGIDINPEFIAKAKASIVGQESECLFVCDDAANMRSHVEDGRADLLFTSPPYAQLLKNVKGSFAYKWKEHSKIASIANPRPYSSAERDLGNMSYDDFLEAIRQVMIQSSHVLKSRAYSAWVVKDFRDLKRGKAYVNFHGDIIACGEAAGFELWDIRIVDQTKFRPLVCLGFPSDNFYLNIGHSYVVIFRNA